MHYGIGVDVSGTRIDYGLFDEDKNLILRRSSETDAAHSPTEFFDVAVSHIQAMMEERELSADQLTGIGICLPAFIQYEEGRLLKTAGLPKLKDFALRDYLSNKLGGVRVMVDVSAQASALAEHRYGAGRGMDNLLYCPMGAGISAGIILDGKLYHGTQGIAGQTGHMIITADEGLDCFCGNSGCFMSWCSGDMIVKHVQSWMEKGETSIMTELAGRPGYITPEHISIAYERGDEMAERALSQMAKYIGIWMYNMYLNLNIDCFIIGGGLLRMGKKLAGPVRKSFDVYNRTRLPVTFKMEEIRRDQGIIGAHELLFV